MKIKIICVGKIRNSPLEESSNEYFKRINRYYPVEIIETKDLININRLIKPDDFVVACDEHGNNNTSKDFADWLEQILGSKKKIVFIIGGAEGLNNLTIKANYKLSLSKMTMQHDLARVALLEQIYRASTIIKGEPYHK